ncbi:hypothetical protein GGS20DRAFT_577762 [Poronia punctata]|nr:hypothetical protein GGS20DRAFT_577762 [Poronia punctata]
MDKWNAEAASDLYKDLEGDLPIRLLLLHPGQRNEALRTELVPTTLDEAQGCYDATSYTWGAPVNPEKIDCGGSQLWVQRNAFNMMVDLRRTDRPRKVWIDAICINQCSLDERAAQVAIMHHIYRRAGATWIWLGPPDEHSSVAMAYAGKLEAKKYVDEFSYCGYASITSRFVEKSYFFDTLFNRGGIDEARLKETVVGIVDFLNRPWFSRVWIQQEASLSRDVHVVCGTDVVDWDNLFALAWLLCPPYTETWPDYVHHRLSRTINNIQAVRIIQRVRHHYFQDKYGPTDLALSFENLVEYVSRYEATDARDRVYAMGNIIQDGNQWFDVDYRVPWQILYTDVARRFLEVDALRFLQNAGRVRQEPDTALPSWAPDYRYKEESEFVLSRTDLWKAGGKSQAAFIPPSNPNAGGKVKALPKGRKRQFVMSDELRDYRGAQKSLLQSFASFRCLMSDEIVYVGGYVDTGKGELDTNIRAIFETVKKDMEFVGSLDMADYINGDSMLDAYKLTLIVGCDAQQEIVRADYVREHWDEWFKWYEQGCPGYWDVTSKQPKLNAALESSSATKNFVFAVTKHGYFCLVPRMAQIGDQIAIFHPYEVAVILRPSLPTTAPAPAPAPAPPTQGKKKQTATAEVYYELVGDAYVHGMMENEARCISDEFNCKFESTKAQWEKILRLSDGGKGEGWKTLDLDGGYERILGTLGPRTLKVV